MPTKQQENISVLPSGLAIKHFWLFYLLLKVPKLLVKPMQFRPKTAVPKGRFPKKKVFFNVMSRSARNG